MFAENLIRDNGDGGGVESAAQIRANRATTAEAATHRFAKEVEEVAGVSFIGFIADLLGEIKVPVASFLDAAGSYPHEVGGGQAENAFPEGFLAMGYLTGEVLGHHAFVGDLLYSRMMEELVKLRSNHDKVAAAIVIERPDPEYIPPTKECAVAAVPNREGEISQNAGWGVLFPLKIRLQDKFSVGAVAERGSFGLERSAQVFTIVDAAVEDEAHSAALVAERLALVEGFWGGAKHAVTQAYLTVYPCPGSMRPATSNSIGHPLQDALVNRTSV
jgi:hypothetical protein